MRNRNTCYAGTFAAEGQLTLWQKFARGAVDITNTEITPMAALPAP
jgi:hypothetical protein